MKKIMVRVLSFGIGIVSFYTVIKAEKFLLN